MTRIIVTTTLRGQLHDLAHPLEFCDESGRVLGHFTPASNGHNADRLEPLLSEEELQRREQEPDYSTEDVLAHLEKL